MMVVYIHYWKPHTGEAVTVPLVCRGHGGSHCMALLLRMYTELDNISIPFRSLYLSHDAEYDLPGS